MKYIFVMKLKNWFVICLLFISLFGCTMKPQPTDPTILLMQKSDFDNDWVWFNEGSKQGSELIVDANSILLGVLDKYLTGYYKNIENYVWVTHALSCYQ